MPRSRVKCRFRHPATILTVIVQADGLLAGKSPEWRARLRLQWARLLQLLLLHLGLLGRVSLLQWERDRAPGDCGDCVANEIDAFKVFNSYE
jgi:hypothetical protein